MTICPLLLHESPTAAALQSYLESLSDDSFVLTRTSFRVRLLAIAFDLDFLEQLAAVSRLDFESTFLRSTVGVCHPQIRWGGLMGVGPGETGRACGCKSNSKHRGFGRPRWMLLIA
jgi:hypothetical protein